MSTDALSGDTMPADWLALTTTKEFVALVEASFNAGNSGIMTKKGKSGGTYAQWRARGSDAARKPIEWLDSADGKRFCDTAAEILNPLKSLKPGDSRFEENQLVMTKKGGNNAGTWAHGQIGLALTQPRAWTQRPA